MTPKESMQAEFPNQQRHLILVVRLDAAMLGRDHAHKNSASIQDGNVFASGEWTQTLRSIKSICPNAIRTLTRDLSRPALNPRVTEYVRSWRAGGGRTVLLAQGDEAGARLADDHPGLFDEVRSVDATLSSDGVRTAECLAEWFGKEGFAYVGCDEFDIPAWQSSAMAVTVGAERDLVSRVERFGKPVEQLGASTGKWPPSLLALRPHQWLKNFLVFVPLLAGHRVDAATVALGVAAFVAFSLVASSFYLFNDLVDFHADRLHPRKSMRPVASGALTFVQAQALAAALCILGVGASALIGWTFLLVIVVYIALTVSYSVFFKRQAVIDICALAALYTLRLIGGAAATGIVLTVWLLAFSLFLFFSLAAVKRQTELVDIHRRGELKPLGRGYRVEDLPIVSMIAVAAGFASVLVLALYINSPEVLQLYSRPELLWGICGILLYWLTHMVIISHRGDMHDDPIVFAVGDRVSQICFSGSALLLLASASL